MRSSDAVLTGLGMALPGVEDIAGLLRRDRSADHEPVDPDERLGRRRLRYKDRATRLALAAAGDALRHAGILRDPGLSVPSESVGVVVSSNRGNLDSVCNTVEKIASATTMATSPMDLPNTSSNVIASWVAIWYGLRGANLTLCNGLTSGLDAMYWATSLVRAGRVARVVVVGVETTNPVVERLAGGDPEGGQRLLDGAVALVVESADSARQRGAQPLAAVIGYSRRASLADVVARVCLPSLPTVELWFGSPGSTGRPAPRSLLMARRHDLSMVFGNCSGALGVLQSAAGAAFVAEGGGSVLATAEGDDAAAAMMLASAGTGR